MSWLIGLFTFIALVSGGAISVLLMWVFRENRYLAALFFCIAVACVAVSVPAFFGVGLLA